MATVTAARKPQAARKSAPAKRAGAPVARGKQRHASTSARVGLWLGRHCWRGLRWTAVTTGRHTGRATVRAAKHTHGQAKQWATDRAQFGFSRAAADCACGWHGPADRMHEHWTRAHADEQPDRSAGFSGDETRANEPSARTKAWAVRLDNPAPEQVADETQQEDEMQDPQNWAHSAEVLAEPSLASTEETIEWFELAERGGNLFTEHIDQLVAYLEQIGMDQKVRDHIDQVREHAYAIREAFDAAHGRADELWGDISVPQFEKAS